ncbi:CPK2, partial [Symbiodinium microadriaticum]
DGHGFNQISREVQKHRKPVFQGGMLGCAGGTRFGSDDSSRCVHFQRPGKILVYKKDTPIFPIGIAVPSDMIAKSVPRKTRLTAGFVGSRAGGEVKEYKFGPMDERRYHEFYRRHRFAHTKKKGGWDATRHAEILAVGTVPNFTGLAQAPPLAVPFVPKSLLLKAKRQLLPFSLRLEAVYNATVERLLDHTRRCLSVESMAARVLRSIGLWPTQRPLRLLYVTCGFGFTGAGDGWQGPVSIGIFLGLQSLLKSIPGSRIVDAPAMELNPNFWPGDSEPRSSFWYLADERLARKQEEALRLRMYGFGFSYARRVLPEALAVRAERDLVTQSLFRREFDGIIYGKVGPNQACDPLPFFNEVQAAGYPSERVALIYGGDFGLETKLVAQHARIFSGHGIIFFREMIAPLDDFHWVPARVYPRACYADPAWKQFFHLWYQRLECWGCPEIDVPVRQELWGELRQMAAGRPWQSGVGKMELMPPCWSGLVLLAVPLLADGGMPARKPSSEDLEDRCEFFYLQLRKAQAFLSFRTRPWPRWRQRRGALAFREGFGISPWEVRAFVDSACRGPGTGAGLFHARFANEARRPLSELRSTWRSSEKHDVQPRSSPGCQRATADLEVRTACKAPSTVWVGADVIKVLAGPELAQLTYRPPSKDEMGPNPLSVAEERGQQSPNDFGSTAEVEPPPKDEAVRAHEYRAAEPPRQMADSPQVLPGFLRNLTQTSYREDFCLRPALQVHAKGGSGLVVCKPSSLPVPRTGELVESEEADDDKMDFTSPRTPFLGRKVPLQSTYNSFCDDRGSLVATPPPPKRNKRNRSEVPLGSLETSSIIKATPMLLPFDTKGVPSGRGGLSDEEILLRSKLLYLDPHPSRQENTKAIFKQGWKQLGKTVMRDNFTSYLHSRSAEKRLGGRSYFPVGEKNWHSCKSDAAFNQGVHQWPRRPLHGPSNGPQRCQTAPGRPVEASWMEACMKSDDKELIAQMTRALIFPESMGLLEGFIVIDLRALRGNIMLQQGQPVATLAELEAALCLAEQQSLVPPTEIRRRWQTLAASAISWSLDCLTAAGEQEWIFDQALQMLCTAEILKRTDVAETFGAKAVPNRLFLRALSLSGLGGYYQQRGKPRAAVRFLEQAVAGHAKFAHPAVLLNLCSAHLQLREPGPALSYLSQAVLALRSAAGRLCPQQAAEVDASATAATAAVLAVLGPAANPEDMCSEVDVRVRKNLWVEMDPLGRGIDLGEQQRLRVEPGGSLETPEASVSSLASQSKEVGKTVRYSGPRRGLGRHGLISKEHAASSKDAFQYEVDAAVVKTLLVAKVLLWPWPELGEEANAVQAQAALTQTRKQETSLAGRCSQKMTFENSSHTYPIRNLYWLHFPKAGTSFMATVWNYACGQGRELLDLTVSDAYAPKCLHCYDFALMERYPKDEYCTQGVLHKQFTTQHRPFSMEQIQGRTLHVAAMFRQPSQRIISAKADGLHASGLSPTGYAELRRKCEHEPTECFARYPGIAGCMTRMLTGKNCAEDSNDRTAPFDGGRALVDEAKKVVGELSFVGLTERWNESVCLFHRMFGGSVNPAEFMNFHHNHRHDGAHHYGEDRLNGFRDEADEAVYAAAQERFESLLRENVPKGQSACDGLSEASQAECRCEVQEQQCGSVPDAALDCGKYTAVLVLAKQAASSCQTNFLIGLKTAGVMCTEANFTTPRSYAMVVYEVQQSQEIVSAYRNGEGHVGLEAALKSIATPGIAKHAAKLKKVWPEWGKIASEAPVPGAGLVLRECLLLTFVHAATALAQLSSKRLYDIWVVPPLREGLVLAIVLFGSKHPLALRLIHACQRAQVPQQPPAPPPDTSRLARPRPRVDPTEPKLRPKPPKTASVKVRARPKRPQTKGHVPAWNAGAGLQPEKEEKLHPAGQVPDAVLALAGGAEYMQAQSARRHGSSRPSVSPVRKDFWTGSQGQRAQEHLERQAKSEIRRELQRPLSSDPSTSRRRRPEATAQGLAPSSTPATPRSQTPETERG